MMFNNPVEFLAPIVGADAVFSIKDDRAFPYVALFGQLIEKPPAYLAVALPGSAEALQQAIAAIHEARLGILYTPNGAGNGATLIRADQPVVILDTRRMNNIIEVHAEYAYAAVEPGVSFRDLSQYFQGHDLPFWVDCVGNPDSSIVGSIIGKQMGHTPYADCSLLQCGAELIFPDGHMLRTGMGGIPGSHTWHLYKYAFGPYLDGLAFQSDLAVVSKLGLWIMGKPPAKRPFAAQISASSLGACVETLRPLLIGGAIPSTVALVPNTIDPSDPVKEWTLFASLYGANDVIDLTWKGVGGALSALEGSKIIEGKERESNRWWPYYSAVLGGQLPTSERPYDAVHGPHQVHVTFAAPLEGAYAEHFEQVSRDTLARHRLPHLRQLNLHSRQMRYAVRLPGTAADASRTVSAAKELYSTLSTAGYHLVEHSFELRGLTTSTEANASYRDLMSRVRDALA